MRKGDMNPDQVAVIPVRRTRTGAQVCIIRRKDGVSWGIPKGNIDRGDTRKQAALNEAYEEAGLLGHVVGNSLGTYDYEKENVPLTVAVFLMEVVEELRTWQEMGFRERRWCSFEEACDLLEDHGVCPLLDRIRVRLASLYPA